MKNSVLNTLPTSLAKGYYGIMAGLFFALSVMLGSSCSSHSRFHSADSRAGAVCYDTVGVKNGHEYVDLGLPSGTLWATCNIGVKSNLEKGDQFMWGNTEPYVTDTVMKDDYFVKTEKRLKKLYYEALDDIHRFSYLHDDNRLDKHCAKNEEGEWRYIKYCNDTVNGIIDNKTELELEDDAANIIWGGKWRIPSQAQLEELFNLKYVHYQLLTLNGVFGCLVTSKIEGYTDRSVFFPATDNRNKRLEYLYGDYWSRTLVDKIKNSAYGLSFAAESVFARTRGVHIRNARLSIRPVWQEKKR